MATQTASGRGNTPPYVSYPSFRTLISDLHEHDVPSRIDRSVLRRFSGIVGTQLLTALRFLRLVDDHNEPTFRLRDLVTAFGTDEWKPKLIAILQEEYAPLFGLDLGNATASHFDETFRKSFPGSDSVSHKSVAFFLGAAKDSGIVISDRVLHGRKPRGANGAVGAKRPKTRNAEQSATKKNAGREARQAAHKPAEGDGANLALDPLLMEMLRRIPAEGEEWPKDQRLRWLRAFAVNVSEVYDDAAKPIDFDINIAATK